MKKQVITLNINDYCPTLTKLTLPTIRRYAAKIGAEYKVIKEEKIKLDPKSGHGGEKFQLYELTKDYDWTIYIDADALVSPDTPDWTEMIGKNQVLFHGNDMFLTRFRATKYTRRTGALQGACTWFTAHSDWCADLWHPPDFNDISWEECMDCISPIIAELGTGHCLKEHLIDDFIVTQNIHRYGLNVKNVLNDLLPKCPGNYLWHIYNCDEIKKVHDCREVIKQWGIKVG